MLARPFPITERHPILGLITMRCLHVFLAIACVSSSGAMADEALLKQHCGKCHLGEDAEAGFVLTSLGKAPSHENLEHWLSSLDRIRAGEMPPSEANRLLPRDRKHLITYLQQRLNLFDREKGRVAPSSPPRRMNNREFARSIADVLMIEDVGTHLPTDNLLGDSRFHGFDTHGATLGFSNFHLEQYIHSVRKIVDATVLSGERPEHQRYEVSPRQMLSQTTSQNTKRPERRGLRGGFDFLDPKQLAYFEPFSIVPTTGRYRIRLQVIGLDRGKYDAEDTGIYDGDPIRLRVEMGDRERIFELPDQVEQEIELNEWLAEGTRLRLQHPTDGLRLLGNGNFKFQNRITAYYFKKYEPENYERLIKTFTLTKNGKKRQPDDWHNWVDYWMGPRPRLLGAVIEGPFYDAWPPKRQTALLGEAPSIGKAEAILTRIAERAWRRPPQEGELAGILKLVKSVNADTGIIRALKEGIVSILVSPQFLLLNLEELSEEQAFASKASYLLRGTTPSPLFRQRSESGEFASHRGIVSLLKADFESGKAESFQTEFPIAWLELNDINFMAPDPAKFHHYHRKLVSEDMVNEVLHLFRYATQQNIPIPELLLADYSFVNADLAKVYDLEDIPQDSEFRKYAFKDGRRGGLLGTGAFLTSTADSLFTSPIHRAIYVMENFLGIEPSPPPADVEIKEPDVRQAKTIKEILSAHRSDSNCRSCHQLIDPFGYAFENYGPDGSWRDAYTIEEPSTASDTETMSKRARPKTTSIPIDAGAEFLTGEAYSTIEGYRQIMASESNKQRFVRCFISKLLTYANGTEPEKTSFAEIDRIVAVSKRHDYHIVETIAAVIDSRLFRESR